MSLSSLLSTARSALVTHQRAIDVTGQNIANAQTPGYSRQRLQITAAIPLKTPFGTIGRGVTDFGVERVRDQFLDGAFRRQQGQLGLSSTLQNLLAQVEGAVNEPSGSGIAAVLDGVFSAFGDLALRPDDTSARVVAQQAAQQLVQGVRQLDRQIGAVQDDALLRLDGAVDTVNALATQIADLNIQILEQGGPLRNAADLEDQRDQLIDRLAKLVDVRVLPRDNGTVGVLAGDTALVDAGFAQQFQRITLPGGGFGVAVAPGSTPVDVKSGELQALENLTTTALPQIRGELDAFVATLVTTVNALHQTGFTQTGATGVAFFDPAGLTAGTVALSAAVAASPSAIATAAVASAPGDGAVAQQIASLRTTPLAAAGGRTLGELYASFASDVGSRVAAERQTTNAGQVLADNLDAQRAGIMSVSLDEEMVALIANQQAFAAAARVVSTADEMMRTILEMV